MKSQSTLATLAVMGIIVLAFLFVFLGSPPVKAVTTTVTGWLIPDGAHWNNAIGAVLYPLVGVGLLAGIAKVLDVDGPFAVTLILAGLTIGGVLGMLSINTSGTNFIPFALVVVPGVDLMIWIWRGEG